MEIAPLQKMERLQQLPLRDYQQDCLDVILNKYQEGTRRQLVSMATGAGKTVVFSHLIRRIARPTLVLAHTTELIEQAREKIRMVCPGLDVGVVNGTSKEFDHHVIVASVQSARQGATLERLRKRDFGLLIIDEGHHAAADSYRGVITALDFDTPSDKLLVGFTATPWRQDDKGLGEVFDEVFREAHHVVVVPVGSVCFEHGEFGIVCFIDPFVAEHFADLKDALHAADDEFFEGNFE